MIDVAQPESDAGSGSVPRVAPVGEAFAVRPLAAEPSRPARLLAGRRTQAVDTTTGYTIRATIPQQPLTQIGDVALIPTLLAAAQRLSTNRQESTSHEPLTIRNSDLRRKVRAARIPNLVLFVVDASGSMAARQRMTAVKGAILSLLLDAYQKRDSVGLISFRGSGASLLLPPTNSVTLAQRHLMNLPTGGRTPLAAGLQLAYQLLRPQTQRVAAPLPLLILLSDGRANVGGERPLSEALVAARRIAQARWSSVVIDCESGYPRLGLAGQIGQALRGEVVRLEALSAGSLAQVVRERLPVAIGKHVEHC